MLRVAKVAGWLPASLKLDGDWDWKMAKVGDFAEVVREVRNLAHPSKYARDHAKSRVTKKYLERQFEIVLACRDWLAAHNDKELLKAIEEEKKKEKAQAAMTNRES